ncbi:23093_t:CDS:2 [Gigaspora margarita]|uniref:23093_t:CDS:1 n=1 Tax=Gigaspora margarita TaxID=4874 RepID=A0ABM8VVJ5_GIGMA|nr:23093_t:CDS:2 [Gigaspora margarita]
MKMIFTLRSGGQTGVDQGCLNGFLDHIKNNIKVLKFQNGDIWKLTGWCPQGRNAEDGKIDPKYPLRETPTPKYEQRTEWNVCDTDATLIFLLTPAFIPELDGTAFTIRMAKRYEKLWKLIFFDKNSVNNIKQILIWIKNNNIKHINICGPRESNSPGIQESTYRFVLSLLNKIQLIKAKI